MPQREMTHRLAAIVVADVAGYARSMEADEAGTLRRLQGIRADIVDPITARYRGRIVKSTGDGWLAEFASVTDAVRSSLDIQRAIAERNAAAAGGLELRIGVNLGEIIVDGDDVFGTGVNVAARLEALARPGGVAVSDAVREQLRGAPDLRCEAMGTHAAKHLTEPIRCFSVHRAALPEAPVRTDEGTRGGAAGVGERGSVAVLPFANLSGDVGQEYFADGMVDDIITALSRFRWLRVTARTSTFAYKGRTADIRQIARELGVRYVLEGSVRKSERRVRITGQLIDATSGAHVWADTFGGDLEDVFDLQDRITESVVGAMEPQLRKAEIERARRKRPENLDAWDLFLRALPHVYVMRPEDNARAFELLKASVRLDPGFAPALAFSAWCYEQRLTRGWPAAREADAATSLRLAGAALAADDDDANTVAVAGFVLVMVGRDYAAGFAALRRALALNPHNAFVAMLAGWAHNFAGDVDEALAHLERAHALSPNDPTAFYVLTGLAMAHLLARRFGEAARLATEAAARYDAWDATYYVLAIALAHAGRTDEARAAAVRVAALHPGASVSNYRKMLPIRDPVRLALLEEGLRAAGLPE